MESWFAQQLYPVRFEWGRDGACRAAARGDIVVIVDVLRFSTTVGTAAHYGISVRPVAMSRQQAESPRVRREEVDPADARAALSPLGYLHRDPGSLVDLESRNGAICTLAASLSPVVIAGALVNATAVGERISCEARGRSVTVVACGERWESPGEDGHLRFALEDYLGAGAILRAIAADKSPEAQVCESAFVAASCDLERLLRGCGSGIELEQKGFGADVIHASRLDLYNVTPSLVDGAFVA